MVVPSVPIPGELRLRVIRFTLNSNSVSLAGVEPFFDPRLFKKLYTGESPCRIRSNGSSRNLIETYATERIEAGNDGGVGRPLRPRAAESPAVVGASRVMACQKLRRKRHRAGTMSCAIGGIRALGQWLRDEELVDSNGQN